EQSHRLLQHDGQHAYGHAPRRNRGRHRRCWLETAATMSTLHGTADRASDYEPRCHTVLETARSVGRHEQMVVPVCRWFDTEGIKSGKEARRGRDRTNPVAVCQGSTCNSAEGITTHVQ